MNFAFILALLALVLILLAMWLILLSNPQSSSMETPFTLPSKVETSNKAVGIGIDFDGHIWYMDWDDKKVYKIDQTGSVAASSAVGESR